MLLVSEKNVLLVKCLENVVILKALSNKIFYTFREVDVEIHTAVKMHRESGQIVT